MVNGKHWLFLIYDEIGEIFMPNYEELIKTLAKETTLPFSKVGIISSLVRLGDTRAIPHFIEALSDENHYVRREAARAIGQLGSPEAIEALLAVLENDSDEETRRNALTALGNIGDERTVEPLRQALKEPSYWIRRAAEMGLKQLQKRLGIQNPAAQTSLKTSIAEEAMNFEEMTSVVESSASVESPMDVEEIPSYRELTDSISRENNVKSSEISESTSNETVSTKYNPSIPPTSPLISDEQTAPPPLFPSAYGGMKGEGHMLGDEGEDTWRCNSCGDEVDSYYDVCRTCGGRRGEPGEEEVSAENVDSEEWFEADFDLNCPKCGEKMLDGYLFTESDDALIFNYQEENDIVIGRGTQMGFICLKCNLISFPFRGEGK